MHQLRCLRRLVLGAALAGAATGADHDHRGVTSLFWSNVDPYGTFRLDMDRRRDLDRGPAVAAWLDPPPVP